MTGRIRISRTGPRTRPWKLRCGRCHVAAHFPTHQHAVTVATDHAALHSSIEGRPRA